MTVERHSFDCSGVRPDGANRNAAISHACPRGMQPAQYGIDAHAKRPDTRTACLAHRDLAGGSRAVVPRDAVGGGRYVGPAHGCVAGPGGVVDRAIREHAAAARSLVLPGSVFNYDAAWWVVAVHALFVGLEAVAACFTARTFFDNVIGLERIVRTRTAALDSKNRDMRLLLDSVE